MIRTIQDFEYDWSQEFEATQKIFKHITDKSLLVGITPHNRTIGRLAWHITTSIAEMMERTGLSIAGPRPDDPVPTSSKEIFRKYSEAAISLLEQVKSGWTDETLQMTDEMYGEKWKRGRTLSALIFHQIHHRAQITVLMRQARLNVPGIYGPSRDEWAAYGMQPPEV